MSANLEWTPELDARLLAMAAAGLSSQAAGAELGRSRNACNERAKKLGRPFRRTDSNLHAQMMKQEQALLGMLGFTPLPEPKPMPFEPKNIPFVELANNHCRAVMGTGPDGLSLSCGHDKRSGSSYCPHHSAEYEVVAQPKKVKLWHGGRFAA